MLAMDNEMDAFLLKCFPFIQLRAHLIVFSSNFHSSVTRHEWHGGAFLFALDHRDRREKKKQWPGQKS